MVEPDASRAASLDVLGALIECALYGKSSHDTEKLLLIDLSLGGFLVLVIITLVSTFRRTVTSQVVRIHVVGFMMFCLSSMVRTSFCCFLALINRTARYFQHHSYNETSRQWRRSSRTV
jgi:hypothetical protein